MTSPQITTERLVLLHNIRSIHNVGSLFRTADAAGITKIFLSGYTPTPIDRFGRQIEALAKVALGGEKSVQWEYIKNPFAVIKKVRDQHPKIKIIGIEQDKNSIDYKTIKLKKSEPVLFIVGNEVLGISKGILKKCDIIAEIPMRGKKESLNVAVSFGIAIFRMLAV